MTEPALFEDDDAPAVLALLAAVDADLSAARVLTIPHATRSKARPRHTKNGHTYQPHADLEAEQETARWLRGLGAPEGGNVAVVCRFYRGDTRRVDADNLAKHVLDAASGVLWVNDDQDTALVALMDLDRGRPRTVVGIAPHRSSLPRAVPPEAVRAVVVGDDPLRRALAEEADRG